MTPIDPDLFARYGLPLTAHVYGPAAAAIAAYKAYRADPIFAPEPTAAQVRLVAEYCEHYISSSLFTYPADELAQVRAAIVQIRTLRELADWLWDCRRIGIWPL
jgi:hypothetical protein